MMQNLFRRTVLWIGEEISFRKIFFWVVLVSVPGCMMMQREAKPIASAPVLASQETKEKKEKSIKVSEEENRAFSYSGIRLSLLGDNRKMKYGTWVKTRAPFQIEVESSQTVYLYIFKKSGPNMLFPIFPRRDIVLENPLRSHKVFRIYPSNKERGFFFNRKVKKETLYIFSSSEGRIEALEKLNNLLETNPMKMDQEDLKALTQIGFKVGKGFIHFRVSVSHRGSDWSIVRKY